MTTEYVSEPSMVGIVRRLSGVAAYIANISTDSKFYTPESVERYKHFRGNYSPLCGVVTRV